MPHKRAINYIAHRQGFDPGGSQLQAMALSLNHDCTQRGLG